MVATILMIFLRINLPNAVLDSTFFVLDSTFWLDSTLKIDPESWISYNSFQLQCIVKNVMISVNNAAEFIEMLNFACFEFFYSRL